MLSGGVQPVRTVMRVLVVRQMCAGRTTVEAGAAGTVLGETFFNSASLRGRLRV